jgi:adenylosuccinate synthase
MLDKSINLPEWFKEPGAYVLVDGQFGSTGKGLMAGVLAEYAHLVGRVPNIITTNAGPNSGHTAYLDATEFTADNVPDAGNEFVVGRGLFAEKIMTQQIPVASVFLERLGHKPYTLLNAGSVIDSDILRKEHAASGIPPSRLMIHPNAAVITENDRIEDQNTLRRIAGTGKGIGPAIANKVMRTGKVAFEEYRPMLPPLAEGAREWDDFWRWDKDVVFVETAQGFSLGLNSARFYPNVTSRECTVMQAISDARIPYNKVRKVVACFRTFPIRVGNTQGSSGGCYEDQNEVSWESLGLEPELTTVTKRVRRVFTWSRVQFRECIAANQPDVIFLNFCNYLSAAMLDALLDNIDEDWRRVMGSNGPSPTILLGFGPYSRDVRQVA